MGRATSLVAIAAVAGVALAAGCERSGKTTAYDASGGPAMSVAPSPSAVRAGDAVKAAVAETVTTGKIKAAIASDSGMKDSDVSVTTDDGVVKLSGTVKSPDQATTAENLAQRQEGVSRVDSQLTVR